MESVTSKRSLFYYSSFVFLVTLIITGITLEGLFLYKLAYNSYNPDFFFLVLVGYLIIAFSAYYIYTQFKKALSFTITKDTFIIKGKKYATADIENISFSGKRDYSSLDRIEGMQINFKGGETVYIYDRYYSNIAKIKRYLDIIWQRNESKEFQTSTKITFPHNNNQHVATNVNFYKGGILNLNLILILFILGFTFIMIFSLPYKRGCEIVVVLPLVLLIVLSGRFYYFGVGHNFIIVKSFARPWIKRQIPIEEIREILLERNGKAPHSMTVIMQDYTMKKYYATTLYDKHWRKLKHDLTGHYITVRDELYLG